MTKQKKRKQQKKAEQPRRFFPVATLQRSSPGMADGGGTAGRVRLMVAGGHGILLSNAPPAARAAAENVALLLPSDCNVPGCEALNGREIPKSRLLARVDEDVWWLYGGTAGQVHDLSRRTPANRSVYHRPASWAGRLGRASTAFYLEAAGTTTAYLVATSLHSLETLIVPNGQERNYVVFGFVDTSDNGWGTLVSEVVEVERVYARGKNTKNPAQDWALLALASAPAGGGLEFSNAAEQDTKLIAVSHSLGLPKSWSPGNLKEDGRDRFVHSCDTLGGSSGAPIVLRRGPDKGKVVGMCIRGGHLRSTVTGGTAPIPVGDPSEPFFGPNVAVKTTAFPRPDAHGKIPPSWPTKFNYYVKDLNRRDHATLDIENSAAGEFTFDNQVQEVTVTHTVAISEDQAKQLHWGKPVEAMSTSSNSALDAAKKVIVYPHYTAEWKTD